MFQSAFLLGDTRSSIVLQTRLGNSIENFVEPEIGELEIRKFKRLVELKGAMWEIRRPATGRYNCAGLVFANRRTSILKPELYVKIFQDDGYRKLENERRVHCGDIVTYVDKSTEEIDHLAIILRLEKGIANGGSPIPWALSKWNSASGEVIHNVYQVPYDLSLYRIDFWTDRPNNPEA